MLFNKFLLTLIGNTVHICKTSIVGKSFPFAYTIGVSGNVSGKQPHMLPMLSEVEIRRKSPFPYKPAAPL